MQITQVKQQELALLINGLRAIWYEDEKARAAQTKLLKQLENELSQRFGLKLNEPA